MWLVNRSLAFAALSALGIMLVAQPASAFVVYKVGAGCGPGTFTNIQE